MATATSTTAPTRSDSAPRITSNLFTALSSFSQASTQNEKQRQKQKQNKNATFLLPFDRLARSAHCILVLANVAVSSAGQHARRVGEPPAPHA